MTFFFNYVKKFAVLAIAALLGLPLAARAEAPFVVKPVNEPEEVRLLASGSWPSGNSQGELMFKLAYIRGLVDALQLAALAPQASNQALNDLEGLSLYELAKAVDDYYGVDDQHSEIPPSSVILRIIGQFRMDDSHEQENGKATSSD